MRILCSWQPGFLFLLFAVVSGCESSSVAPPTDSTVPAGSKSQSPASPVSSKPGVPKSTSPPDLSLPAGKYAVLGLPSHERAWAGNDMQAAAKALSEIARDSPDNLPRFNSPNSGAVFARITSQENLDMLRNRSFPLPLRMAGALQFVQATSSINKTYVNSLLVKKTGSEESTELLGLTLRTSVVMTELVEEFFPTLDKKDPTYAIRVQGLAKMKAGMGNVLQGSILHVTELMANKPEMIGKMLEFMDETFPPSMKSVPPAVREETLEKLRKMRDKPEYTAHRAAIDQIITKISTVPEESKTE